jgi:hypothetical protein
VVLILLTIYPAMKHYLDKVAHMATRSSHHFSSRLSTKNHSTPAFWFNCLTLDGILVTHLGTAPSLVGVGGYFQDQIHAVVEAGFPCVIDFDSRHPQRPKLGAMPLHSSPRKLKQDGT